MSPTKKTPMTKWLKKPMKKKATESTQRLPALLAAVSGGITSVAGLADQLRDGNDLVAARAQGVDEHGQGGDGG